MEGMGDVSIWMSRLLAGAGRWGQAVRLTDDPEWSEQNPILFQAPDGGVRLFHTSQPGGDRRSAKSALAHHGMAVRASVRLSGLAVCAVSSCASLCISALGANGCFRDSVA